VEWLLNLAGMPRSLADCSVTPSSIPLLAAEAAKQWTASFNPRPVGEKDFAQMFEAAFAPRGPGAPYGAT
jgi:alcohol dehydrogenase